MSDLKMCGIIGIINGSGQNVVPLVREMISSIKNRGPDGFGFHLGGKIIKCQDTSALSDKLYYSGPVLGHARLAIVGGSNGSQPLQSCDGRFILEHNGEIYNYKEIKKKLKETHEFLTDTDSEVIVHLLEEKLEKYGMIDAIKQTVSELDGVYAIVIKDQNDDIYLIRDPMGVRQLYYAQDGSFFAFASEKKALWKAGLYEPIHRVMPASCVCITKNGKISTFNFQTISYEPIVDKSKFTFRTMDGAIKAYEKALINSMRKRTQDLDRIGIIFSGGIDSVLIAWLAKKMVKEVICYTGGIRGSNDIKYAKQISDVLGFDLKINELNISDVEGMLPDIISTIEETNVGQVEVAIPVYSAVKIAKSDGIRVMFSGQGADEIYGGYSWYSRIVSSKGYDVLQKYMLEDLSLLYKETLEREDKITMAHSIEMREPFLDKDVVSVALNTDIRLKVFNGRDVLGKRVHRLVSEKLGIPKEIAFREKEAAQHGSGLHDALDVIAKKNGYNSSIVTSSIRSSLLKREKLGSSQRYGYLYDESSKWINSAYVQVFLDSLCNKVPKLAPLIIN